MVTCRVAPDAASTQPLTTKAKRSSLLWFVVAVVSALCVLVVLARVRPLAFDEILSWHTAHLSSPRSVLHVQATAPVSLDPPLFHLLNWTSAAVDPTGVLGIRSVAIVAALLFFATLWFFVRRMMGVNAAWLTVIGMFAAENFYLTEARPYAILLASAGLGLVSWQQALRRPVSLSARATALGGLFLSVAMATSVHYFGILLAVPFLAVEGIRWRRNGSLDVVIVGAVLLGLSAVVTWLPFVKAAKQYKSGYYVHVKLSDLLWSYNLPFERWLRFPAIQYEFVVTVCILLLLIAGLRLSWRRLRQREASVDEWYLLALFIALPLIGVALSTLTSGAFESRYVIEFSIGITIATCGGLLAVVRRRWTQLLVIAVAGLMTACSVGRTVTQERRGQTAVLNCIAMGKISPLVFTNDEAFLQIDQLQRSDQRDLRPMYWVADVSREARFDGSDNVDRTMLNLKQWGGLPILSYEELRERYPAFTLVEVASGRPKTWLPAQLSLDQWQISSSQLLPPCSLLQMSEPQARRQSQ